jgi:hypothetical protein
MAGVGHEERFPPTRLSAGCGFRKETIAGMRRNGRDAPKAAAPVSLGPGGIKRPLLFGEPIDQPVEE